MNEDAACGQPCGFEPMGCAHCDIANRQVSEEYIRHKILCDEVDDDLEPREDYEW